MKEASPRLWKAIAVDALRESENALTDYVDRLEKRGGTMGYGHSVIAKVRAALRLAGEL